MDTVSGWVRSLTMDNRLGFAPTRYREVVLTVSKLGLVYLQRMQRIELKGLSPEQVDLTALGINPESCDDGHSLRTLDGQPFVGATTDDGSRE